VAARAQGEQKDVGIRCPPEVYVLRDDNVSLAGHWSNAVMMQGVEKLYICRDSD
jgi:hypothetical protein